MADDFAEEMDDSTSGEEVFTCSKCCFPIVRKKHLIDYLGYWEMRSMLVPSKWSYTRHSEEDESGQYPWRTRAHCKNCSYLLSISKYDEHYYHVRDFKYESTEMVEILNWNKLLMITMDKVVEQFERRRMELIIDRVLRERRQSAIAA